MENVTHVDICVNTKRQTEMNMLNYYFSLKQPKTRSNLIPSLQTHPQPPHACTDPHNKSTNTKCQASSIKTDSDREKEKKDEKLISISYPLYVQQV